MEIRPIKTEIQYREALAEMKKYWGAEPNTPEGNKLELFMMITEKYESEVFTIPKLDAIDAIKYRMEENNLSQKDLVKYFGTKSRVSEIFKAVDFKNDKEFISKFQYSS